MQINNFPDLKEIHTIIIDFDGVLTNNLVLTDHNGVESVSCNRSDGLGFNLLKKFLEKNNYEIEYFILSTESNPVVKKRAEKLNVKFFQGVNSKDEFIFDYLNKRFGENKLSRQGIIYIGNDINDLKAMLISGYKVCPNDADDFIKLISDLVLNKEGGKGCVREFIEYFLKKGGFDKERLMELI